MNETYIKSYVGNEKRTDNRKLDEFRKISVEKGVSGNAEGSARVKIGKTEVIAGIKMEVREPYPDTPNDGNLMISVELSPVGSPEFRMGPPSEQAVELSRVIDRGIRESKSIETEKLCITPKEAVWSVSIDIAVINDDGNLMDAGALAAIAALTDTKLPKYDSENKKIIREETQGPLLLTDKPIAVTIYKIGEKLLLDVTSEEEDAIDARITLTSTEKGDLCAIQKGGTGLFTTAEVEKAADLSILKGKELRKLLK